IWPSIWARGRRSHRLKYVRCPSHSLHSGSTSQGCPGRLLAGHGVSHLRGSIWPDSTLP
uniref:Uncharacterized protein n=1 Tax=Crocodylus porosus TaxID=8502 RepID=A0A7M4EWR5_CROPO